MKPFGQFVFSLLLIVGLSGCLQDEKIVKVKPDGSGTIEETFMLGKQALAQIKQMTEGFGALAKNLNKGGGGSPTEFKVLDESKLRETAEKMGEGVKFVSAKPVSTETGEGYTAIYSFTDISKVKLDQNPTQNLPSSATAISGNKVKKEPVKFEFKKGSPAILTVKMPVTKDSDLKDRPQVPPAQQEMAAAMMQQMFKDMKVSVVLEFAGRIVESNAEFQDASRVTLAEMDFNKLLANPEKMKALMQAQPKTIEEAKTLVKGVDGMKAETQPAVTVKFQ